MKILYWILAVATIIGGIAAIDYFCNQCIKKFNLIAYFWKRRLRNRNDDMEEPRGQVPLDSSFYIERPPIESSCYTTIVNLHALIRIKAPRQMGKSSLLARILQRAEQEGFRTVWLSFQEADSHIFANFDQFLQWFCGSVAEQLGLPDNLVEHWQGILGSKNKCTNYFEKHLFAKITAPLVVGLDEVDLIFAHKTIAADFFGLLRAWHEKSKHNKIWQQFRLVITHSQEVYIHVDAKESPFNVGSDFKLPLFDSAQMQDLIQRYQLNGSEEQIAQLMTLVGGHPYLLHFALYQITIGQWTLENLIKKAPYEDGPYAEHLRHHWLNLQAHPELVTATQTIMVTNHPIPVREIKNAFQLQSMGLIKIENDNVMPLCDLYQRYFGNRLL